MAGRTFGKTGYDENFSAPISTGQPEADGRIPCAVCGRKFASDRIGTHQKIFRKIKMKGEAEEFDIASKRTKEINDELRFSGGGRGGSRGRKMAGGKRKGAKFINPATRFGGRGGGGTMASHIESQEATKKKSSWRSQHESFITNVHAELSRTGAHVAYALGSDRYGDPEEGTAKEKNINMENEARVEAGLHRGQGNQPPNEEQRAEADRR
jgi:hypothetical protein